MMTTPKDNTQVVRMLKDFKDSVWKDTPLLRATHRKLNNRGASTSNLRTTALSLGSCDSNVVAKLNFNSFDDSAIPDAVSATPDAMKRKVETLELELKSSNAKLREKEAIITNMEPHYKRVRMNMEVRQDSVYRQCEINSRIVEELETRVSCYKGELTNAKEQMIILERQKKIQHDKATLVISALKQEISNFKVEMAGLKSEKTEIARKLNNEIGRMELKIKMMTDEAEKSEDYIQSLKKQNNELAEKAALYGPQQKELQEAEAKIKELENKIEAEKDAALIVQTMQSELQLLSEIQKENKVLKEEVSKYKESNVVLYQEKMWTFQEKLAYAEKKIASLVKLQAENEQLKERLAQWEELLDDGSVVARSPSAFTRKLSYYQKNEAILTNKVSQLTSRFETLEKQKKELEDANKNLNLQLRQIQVTPSCQESMIKRLQRKITYLTKERDSCRRLLDSYISESTMSGIVNTDYVAHLEELNEEYKKAIEKVENEIDALNQKVVKMSTENSCVEMLTAEVKRLRDENSLYQSRIVQMEKERSGTMNSSDTKSAIVPATEDPKAWGGKILHAKFNPHDNAARRQLEEFRRLQDENDRLKKRIKVLEEEGSASTDVTFKVEQKLQCEGSDSTLKGLQEQLAAAERQQRFILESAKATSKEFREAVYRLTGYRIDVPMAETYKLSHVYADSRDDYLLFKINTEGIQLVETEYSKHLTDKVELYLQKSDSFPAFLASLTMDLFSQQTCIND